MEVGNIIEGSFNLKSTKAEQSKVPKATDAGRFCHLTKTTSSSRIMKKKGERLVKK